MGQIHIVIEGFIGVPIDHSILGIAHEYKGEGVPFDPEGLFSTIPAIPQVLFGYLIGNYIQKRVIFNGLENL